VNLGVIFLLELGVLGSVWYCAWRSDSNAGPMVGLFGIVALGWLWGLFGSPRARFKLRGAARVAFETLWFGVGAVLWYAAGAHIVAIVFAALCAVSKTCAVIWRQ
jgi:hypothetical protein